MQSNRKYITHDGGRITGERGEALLAELTSGYEMNKTCK